MDIDLNYVGAPDRDTMLAEKPKLEQAVQAVYSREGLNIERAPSDHAGGKWRLSYVGSKGASGKLELDVNFMFRTPLWRWSGLRRRQKVARPLAHSYIEARSVSARRSYQSMNILQELRSPREVRIEQSPSRVEIRFHLISRQDLKRNWFMLFVFSFVFCVVPLLCIPYLSVLIFKVTRDEPLAIFAMLPALTAFIVLPVFVYRVGFRKVFTVRSLLFDESEFSIVDIVFGKLRTILAVPRSSLPPLSVEKAWSTNVAGISDTKLMLSKGTKLVEVIGHRPSAELEQLRSIYEAYRAGAALDLIESHTAQQGAGVSSSQSRHDAEMAPENKQSMWRAVFGLVLSTRGSRELPRSTFHKVNALLGVLTGLFALGILSPILLGNGASPVRLLEALGLSIAVLVLLSGYVMDKRDRLTPVVETVLLVLSGVVLLGLAVAVVVTMLSILLSPPEGTARVVYSPVTWFLAPYGSWLVLHFGRPKERRNDVLEKWLPRLAFIAGAAIDLAVVVKMFSSFAGRLGRRPWKPRPAP